MTQANGEEDRKQEPGWLAAFESFSFNAVGRHRDFECALPRRPSRVMRAFQSGMLHAIRIL